jgi:stringent starvation protein B
VPQEHVKDGQIVLNVSPVAVQDLIIDDHYVSFNGRFAGVSRRVLVPIGAMLGIYARENGEGMMFKAEILPEPEPPAPSDSSASGTQASSSQKKPALRLVK